MDINVLLAALKPAEPAEYCLFWIQWWPLCMTKSEWSGWVAAIGTIGTIAGAAAGIWWQVVRQEAKRVDEVRAAEVHRLQVIWSLFDEGAQALDSMWLQAGSGAPWAIANPIRDAVETLRVIGPFDAPDARTLLWVRYVVRSYDTLLAELKGIPEGHPYQREARRALDAFLGGRENLRQQLARRGADIPKDPNIV